MIPPAIESLAASIERVAPEAAAEVRRQVDPLASEFERERAAQLSRLLFGISFALPKGWSLQPGDIEPIVDEPSELEKYFTPRERLDVPTAMMLAHERARREVFDQILQADARVIGRAINAAIMGGATFSFTSEAAK